jgi:hypothetical protein
MAGEDSKLEKNVFRIGRNTFYDWKNKIPMKILEFKRSGIGLITEFRRIPNGFPNQFGAGRETVRIHEPPLSLCGLLDLVVHWVILLLHQLQDEALP